MASLLAALDSGLAKLADPNLPTDAKDGEIQKANNQEFIHLKTVPRLLLIVDNFDEIVQERAFKDLLARKLLTYCHGNMGEVRQVSIDKVDEHTGALYLLHCGKGDKLIGPWKWEDFREEGRRAALELSREFDGLPLALHQAVGAVRDHTPIRTLIAKYGENRQEIVDIRGQSASVTHPDSIWFMVGFVLELLREKSPAAADLVTRCAFLAPTPSRSTSSPTAGSSSARSSKLRLGGSKWFAARSNFIEFLPDEVKLALQRVTQAVIQGQCVASSNARFDGLGWKAELDLGSAGRYFERLSHVEFCLEGNNRLNGETHRDTQASMNILAATYSNLVRHEEAFRSTKRPSGSSARIWASRTPTDGGSWCG